MADDAERSELRELLTRATERGYVLLSEIHDVHEQLDGHLDDAVRSAEAIAAAAADRGIEVVDDLSDIEAVPTADPGTHPSSTDGVRQYLNAIGRVELLSAEEEVDLAKRFHAGSAARQLLATGNLTGRRAARLRRLAADGTRAQERLVTANLRLVVSVARRYLGRGLSLLELVQEGNLGLMRAVEKFDHTKGYKFSTYATWWIRQALTRGTANKARSVRLPVHVHELVAKVRRTEFELLQILGRDPTDDEVADTLGLSVDRLRELRMAGRDITSLDRTVGEDGDTTLGELVRDDDAPDPQVCAESEVAREQLIATLADLHERERGVMRLRYGLDGDEPHTLEEIGELYGVTRERIRQIERTVIAKLRHPAHADRLRDLVSDR
ncbi:MAG: sigma-70 family RNA polymerase sigma factor [Nitriliruptoraceae bacterium]